MHLHAWSCQEGTTKGGVFFALLSTKLSSFLPGHSFQFFPISLLPLSCWSSTFLGTTAPGPLLAEQGGKSHAWCMRSLLSDEHTSLTSSLLLCPMPQHRLLLASSHQDPTRGTPNPSVPLVCLCPSPASGRSHCQGSCSSWICIEAILLEATNNSALVSSCHCPVRC